jgi:uncharacterized protein YecE (DUF72 family)
VADRRAGFRLGAQKSTTAGCRDPGNGTIDLEARKPAGIEPPPAGAPQRPDHDHLYSGSYSDADLAWWPARIQEWDATGKDVFAYFNNDGDAHAVRNARTLRAILCE